MARVSSAKEGRLWFAMGTIATLREVRRRQLPRRTS